MSSASFFIVFASRYLIAFINDLGARRSDLRPTGAALNADEWRVVSLLLWSGVTLAVMLLFFFFRKVAAADRDGRTATGKEIFAYIAAHVVGLVVGLSVMPPIYAMMRRSGLAGSIEYVSYGGAGLVTILVFGLFVALRKIVCGRDDDWISSYASDRSTIFKVKQRRFDRLLKVGYIAGGAGALVYLIMCLMRADWTAPLMPVGILALFAGVAGLVGLAPALWALKETDVSTFVLSGEGVVTAGPGGTKTTLSWGELDGPYYAIAGQLEKPAGSFVYAGAGVSGVAFVGAYAVTHATKDSIMGGLNFVRSDTRGSVYFKHRGRQVVLARLLSDDEAEYLADRVAEAAARATS